MHVRSYILDSLQGRLQNFASRAANWMRLYRIPMAKGRTGRRNQEIHESP